MNDLGEIRPLLVQNSSSYLLDLSHVTILQHQKLQDIVMYKNELGILNISTLQQKMAGSVLDQVKNSDHMISSLAEK